jgi:hypothetical protein
MATVGVSQELPPTPVRQSSGNGTLFSPAPTTSVANVENIATNVVTESAAKGESKKDDSLSQQLPAPQNRSNRTLTTSTAGMKISELTRRTSAIFDSEMKPKSAQQQQSSGRMSVGPVLEDTSTASSSSSSLSSTTQLTQPAAPSTPLLPPLPPATTHAEPKAQTHPTVSTPQPPSTPVATPPVPTKHASSDALKLTGPTGRDSSPNLLNDAMVEAFNKFRNLVEKDLKAASSAAQPSGATGANKSTTSLMPVTVILTDTIPAPESGKKDLLPTTSSSSSTPSTPVVSTTTTTSTTVSAISTPATPMASSMPTPLFSLTVPPPLHSLKLQQSDILLTLAFSSTYGLSIKDRRRALKTYKQCFVASECVDWLMTFTDADRADACK